MTRRTILLTTFAAPLAFAAKKNSKGDEVQLLEHSAKVEEGRVVIDGRVKNLSEKPIRRLRVVYEILDSDKHVLTSQKGGIEEEMLDPDAEAGFSGQIAFHARSVFYRFGFEDGSEKELRCTKAGPFPIE